MIFIGVTQQRIGRGYLVYEVDGRVRQIDVVDINKIESTTYIVITLLGIPFVFPCSSGNYACIFRPLLIVGRDSELCRRVDALLERSAEQWRLELREGYADLAGKLRIAVIYKTVKFAGKRLIGGTEFSSQHLGAFAEIAVLVGKAHTESKIALGISALQFD